MTRQRALSPLTLLLASFLCYGFVLVWTQNVALETTTTFEDHSTPFLPAGVKILTGGNFSVSVPPWESTTEPPVVSTQNNLALHSTIIENATTVIPRDSVTYPLPTMMESLSSMVPTGGAEVITEDELISHIDNTGGPQTTTIKNAANTERKRSTTELGMPTEGIAGMGEGTDGVAIPSSARDNSNKLSSGTTIDGGTTDTTATSAGGNNGLAAQPRSMKTSSTGGKMTWRVTLQSSLSREEAVTQFFEKICEAIIKNLHMKDLSITWGPDRTTTKCL